MIVSEARINANRRNAQLSTGPRTEEGKRRSRANGIKHGLCSSVVVEENVELVQHRAAMWFESLKPQNDFHCWLVDRIAIGSIRIDRCERMERRVRDRKAMRAELCWDDDRRLDAASLGGLLSKRPDQVVEELRRTPQGCEWLMTRWAMLAHEADVKKEWSPDQVRLAFDLLGTPAEFRAGNKPGAPSLDFDGKVLEPADDPAAVARREIAALKERRELVAGLDEVNQALTEADLYDEDDAELKRLRRYESTLHRRLRWCLEQLHFKSPFARSHPSLAPRWNVEPEHTPAPPPLPTPEEVKAAEIPYKTGFLPFDLEPDEFPPPGQDADLPKIVAGRREKARIKAEARREARRRKLDRLRA